MAVWDNPIALGGVRHKGRRCGRPRSNHDSACWRTLCILVLHLLHAGAVAYTVMEARASYGAACVYRRSMLCVFAWDELVERGIAVCVGE